MKRYSKKNEEYTEEDESMQDDETDGDIEGLAVSIDDDGEVDVESMSEEEIELLMELKEEAEEKKRKRLDSLGQEIKRNINKAVTSRSSSGIEKVWQEDENYYEGIDQYNQGDASYTKPRGETGGLISNQSIETDGCTKFFNITRQFVDSASARMSDILLPANSFNFSVKKTPIPEMFSEGNGSPVNTPQDMQSVQGSGESMGNVQETIGGDDAKDDSTEAGEKRIQDWTVETRLSDQERKVIESAAKLGTGIIKGPVPVRKTIRIFSNGESMKETKVVPGSMYVSVWDFFPDPACGDNIQDGNFVAERSFMTARQLSALKGTGYINDNVDKVLEEGAKSGIGRDVHEDVEGKFEVWHYYGMIETSDLDLIDEECDPDDEDKYKSVVLTIVNDTVIKGHISPLNNDEFPYDVMCWQRREGSPFGIGIARQGRVAQEVVLSSSRALMDNMSLSSSVMLGINREAIIPASGKWGLNNKIWWMKPSSGLGDIRQAITSIEVPSRQQELIGIIQLGMKMMEDSTGVSFLLQGQQGSAPDTVGGMQLLHNNASSLLRRIARVFDASIIEPHIRRYYDWLLEYGEDEEKGDISIEAVGSSSLVEKEIQRMELQNVLDMAMNPAFGLSPKKTSEELLKAMGFEPSKFAMSQEEIQQMQQAQQPQDPRIQVAEMNNQVQMQLAQMKSQVEMQKAQMDTDRDSVFNQGVAERNQMTYEMKLQELQLKRELAMMEYANTQKLTLEKVKADLAGTVMKLNVQKEMAANNAQGKAAQVITPPVEPVGRAPEGQAFTR